jgi:hypothetical protein
MGPPVDPVHFNEAVPTRVLYTLSYAELRLIAEGKNREARHVHAHGIDTLVHRTETSPIPYAYRNRLRAG